jgi:hypothetical protein
MMWQDELDDGLINKLLQTIVIAFAAALVAGYWPGAGQQGSQW